MIWPYILAIVLVGAPFGLCACLFRVFMMRPRKVRTPMPHFDPFHAYAAQIAEGKNWFAAQNPETVSITSFDGLTLRAQIVTHPQAVGTVIMAHGYHGSGVRDFSCALRGFYEKRMNLVVPDQRASGASEGRYITFGALERFDLRDWILFTNQRFGDSLSIVLDGVSMGAATVMLACGLELPGNIAGAIVDAGYTSAYEIVRLVLKKGLKLPRWPFLPICEWLTRTLAGYSLREADCIAAVAQARFPILFAHGGADDFVPTHMGIACYEACQSEKRLLIVPGAGHGMSYLVDREGYEKLLAEFLLDKL